MENFSLLSWVHRLLHYNFNFDIDDLKKLQCVQIDASKTKILLHSDLDIIDRPRYSFFDAKSSKNLSRFLASVISSHYHGPLHYLTRLPHYPTTPLTLVCLIIVSNTRMLFSSKLNFRNIHQKFDYFCIDYFDLEHYFDVEHFNLDHFNLDQDHF